MAMSIEEEVANADRARKEAEDAANVAHAQAFNAHMASPDQRGTIHHFYAASDAGTRAREMVLAARLSPATPAGGEEVNSTESTPTTVNTTNGPRPAAATASAQRALAPTPRTRSMLPSAPRVDSPMPAPTSTNGAPVPADTADAREVAVHEDLTLPEIQAQAAIIERIISTDGFAGKSEADFFEQDAFLVTKCVKSMAGLRQGAANVGAAEVMEALKNSSFPKSLLARSIQGKIEHIDGLAPFAFLRQPTFTKDKMPCVHIMPLRYPSKMWPHGQWHDDHEPISGDGEPIEPPTFIGQPMIRLIVYLGMVLADFYEEPIVRPGTLQALQNDPILKKFFTN